jgi:hypothetical protein
MNTSDLTEAWKRGRFLWNSRENQFLDLRELFVLTYL